jgi:hypothetical protein
VLAEDFLCGEEISCWNPYDKLIGNVSSQFALERFKTSGDLAKQAEKLLNNKIDQQ